MLEFPYLDEPVGGPSPPSLPAGSSLRWRPFIPVTVVGPAGRHFSPRALLDTGADDSVFPLGVAQRLGVHLQSGTQHGVRWRGQKYGIQFGSVELLISDGKSNWRWPAVVGFSAAPIRYPILGQAGCLAYINATFFGDDRIIRLQTNKAYPGSTI